MQFLIDRLTYPAAVMVIASALLAPAPMSGAKAESVKIWPILKEQAFGDRAISEEDGMVVLETPSKVEDAAIVPLTVRIPPHVRGKLKSLSLFIDNNPDPKVATLAFGPAAGMGGERSFSTRVRVDNFSPVRAVLETEDGSLHMTTKFLAAAGGCGAMQAKDPEADTAGLGKMIVKAFPPALESNPIFAAQVMIKHPNDNGMQLDVDTANFIPARFVKEMTVNRDGELVFKLTSTFSISTNPNFRFTFGRGADNELDVRIVDTDGAEFMGRTEPTREGDAAASAKSNRSG